MLNIKKILSLLVILCISFICTACNEEITMSYNSSDYENGDWTVDEIVDNLEELGFSNIKIEERDSRLYKQTSISVGIEEELESLSVSIPKDFKKGDTFDSYTSILIQVVNPIPVLTLEDNPELLEILPLRYSNPEKWEAFMKENNNSYIEFNGTLADWNDKYFWVSIDFDITFENNEDILFYWDVSTEDIGHRTDYHSGMIKEGDKAHIVAKIQYTEDNCEYILEDFQIIE